MFKTTELQTVTKLNPVNYWHNTSSHIDKHNVRFATHCTSFKSTCVLSRSAHVRWLLSILVFFNSTLIPPKLCSVKLRRTRSENWRSQYQRSVFPAENLMEFQTGNFALLSRAREGRFTAVSWWHIWSTAEAAESCPVLGRDLEWSLRGTEGGTSGATWWRITSSPTWPTALPDSDVCLESITNEMNEHIYSRFQNISIDNGLPIENGRNASRLTNLPLLSRNLSGQKMDGSLQYFSSKCTEYRLVMTMVPLGIV